MVIYRNFTKITFCNFGKMMIDPCDFDVLVLMPNISLSYKLKGPII